ncbi:hemerythrin domain-containing protein [Polaromonas aquatica]|uniref:hemerythrin domain-containing protein n=1 Tax=Polaromonas aquatica TaxID=332657 RepID=UPI003D64EA24
MTVHHATSPSGAAATPAGSGPVDLSIPLAGFSQCHFGIASQLQAFAELPALQAAAVQARNVALHTLSLFKYAVASHHADEENELFPAVLRSAAKGEEADKVRVLVKRLVAEHRKIESIWKDLEPAVKAVTRNRPVELDLQAVEALVQAYLKHARFEEEEFLPLAEAILGRNGNHMAALGLSLHLKHAPLVAGHV